MAPNAAKPPIVPPTMAPTEGLDPFSADPVGFGSDVSVAEVLPTSVLVSTSMVVTHARADCPKYVVTSVEVMGAESLPQRYIVTLGSWIMSWLGRELKPSLVVGRVRL
jgi:hypothetical protein